MRSAGAAAVAALAVVVSAAASDPNGLISTASPFAGCAGNTAFTNAEAEPSLAADPRDATRLVAAYQQDRYERAGGARGIIAATSTDGGTSWRHYAVPVSSCAAPHRARSSFASDPWVAVGPDGRIYVSMLTTAVSVVTSTDWGRTWSKPRSLRGPGFSDKPAITADPHHAGTAFVLWSDYLRTNPPGTESDELLSITRDGGRTWSGPKPLLRHDHRAGPEDGQVLVDPRNDRVYVVMVWVRNGLITVRDPGAMMITHSDDGGRHWSAVRRFAAAYTAPQPAGRVIRSSPQVPSFVVDGAGALYGVWQDSRFSRGAKDEVVFTRSTDGGAHWSSPRKISAPSAGGALIPTLGASRTGHVAVLYLQVKGGTSPLVRYRLATSVDGGRRFRDRAVSKSFRIADAPRLTSSPLVPGGYFLGDYMGVATLGANAFGVAYVAARAAPDDRTAVVYATSR